MSYKGFSEIESRIDYYTTLKDDTKEKKENEEKKNGYADTVIDKEDARPAEETATKLTRPSTFGITMTTFDIHYGSKIEKFINHVNCVVDKLYPPCSADNLYTDCVKSVVEYYRIIQRNSSPEDCTGISDLTVKYDGKYSTSITFVSLDKKKKNDTYKETHIYLSLVCQDSIKSNGEYMDIYKFFLP